MLLFFLLFASVFSKRFPFVFYTGFPIFLVFTWRSFFFSPGVCAGVFLAFAFGFSTQFSLFQFVCIGVFLA